MSICSSAEMARSIIPDIERLMDQQRTERSAWETELIENGMTKKEIEKFKELWFKIDAIRRKQWMDEYDKQIGAYAKNNDGHATGFKSSVDLRKERPSLLDI